MLPNFLIIGAQKAGTTSLWAYLRSHPEVHLLDDKEPGFFVEEINWGRGLGWYESLFDGAGDAIARGEASTYYTMYPFFDGVPERIATILPDVKLIYVMRDPVERMRSAYMQLLAEGTERRPMSYALLFDSRYLLLSSYALQLERYLECFERSQILLLTAEELVHQREETMRRVCGFLGVNPSAPIDLSNEFNVSKGKRLPTAAGRLLRSPAAARVPRLRNRVGALLGQRWLSRDIPPEMTDLSDEVRRRMADTVRPDVERLAQWMGPSFSGWGLIASPEVTAGPARHAEVAEPSPQTVSP